MSWQGRPYVVWLARGAVGAAVVLLLVIVPIAVVPALEDRGLPGVQIGLAVLVVVAAWSVRVVWTQRGRPARAFALRRFARGIDGRYAARFSVPGSMRSLPSLSEPSGASGVRNLVTHREGDRTVWIFDRWFEPEETYRSQRWWTTVATELDMDASKVRIEARSLVPPAMDGLAAVGTESGAFDARFRVLADDARLASAIVDQRMMAWLLELPDDVDLEVGGRWAAVSRPGSVDPGQLPDLAATLDGFVRRIPAVVGSLRPLRDPAHRGRDHV